MKKKIVFIIFLILIGLVNVKAESTPQRGDLRCPLELPNNVKCSETKNGQGVVTRVDLVYGSLVNDGDIQITKTVTKNLDDIGHYNVQFNVKGKNVSQKKVSEPIYISMIIDLSSSIGGYWGTVKQEIKKFARRLIPVNDGSSNVQFSLDEFATSLYKMRGFENKNFDDTTFYDYKCGKNQRGNCLEPYSAYKCPSGKCHSNVGSGLKSAFNKLKKKTDGKRYTIIIGDGYYWVQEKKCDEDQPDGDDTCIALMTTYADKIRALDNSKMFFIRYPTRRSEEEGVTWWLNQANHASCYGKEMRVCHRKSAFRILTGDYNSKRPDNFYESSQGWENIFTQIGDEIEEESSSTYVVNLNDKIGDDFYLTNDTGNYQNFNVGKLTEENGGWTSPIFEIEIDQNVKGDEPNGGGWHETNKNFTLTYTDESGEEQKITVDENPEVYWIPYDANLHTCHEVSETGSSRKDESDEFQYFKRSCKEGYMKNGEPYNGFQVEQTINGIIDLTDKTKSTPPRGTRDFAISSGLGFPSELRMSTNVVCTYQFDADAYNKRYNQLQNVKTRLPDVITQLQNELNDGSLGLTEEERKEKEEEIVADTKELASAEKELNNMALIYNSYVSYNSENDLKEYADRFKNQKATLAVHYYDASLGVDEFEYANIEDTVNVNNIDCTVKKRGNVAGKDTVLNRECKVTFSKKMQIKGSCLNMQTGNPEECSVSSKNQIIGGAKVYTNLKSKGGYITIKIPNAGYNEDLDIELKKDNPDGKEECSFKPDDVDAFGDIMYRQIQLDDPFLKKNYNANREVGKNYLNNKFDFREIIHSDTWSSDNESEYDYLMSKTNIKNIRKDTREDKNSAYLGRNCYFTPNSKYQCDFTRNQTETSANNGNLWFSGVKIK